MAYEVSKLVEKLKSKGLDVVEETAIEAISAIAEWAEDSAKEGTKPVVDGLVLVMAPQAAKVLKELADKIDGQVG